MPWLHRHDKESADSRDFPAHQHSYQPPPVPPPNFNTNTLPIGLYTPPPGPPPGQYAEPPSFSSTLPGFNDSQTTTHFKYSDVNASEEDADRARRWMRDCYPPGSNQNLYAAKMLPSEAREYIRNSGARAWGLYNPADSINWQRDLAMYTDRRHTGSEIVISNTDGLIKIVTAGGKPKTSNPFRQGGHGQMQCRDMCLLSTLPLLGGQYNIPIHGWTGVYYEVTINYMKSQDECKENEESGGVAIGTACIPYPPFRLPGWQDDSFAWHADDSHAFAASDDGGQLYPPLSYTSSHHHLNQMHKNPKIMVGDTIGCGLDVSITNGNAHLFFTHARGGKSFRLPILTRDDGSPAYTSWNRPGKFGEGFDVYAAIGVCGATEVEVNFGVVPFKWDPANSDVYRMDQHIGNLG